MEWKAYLSFLGWPWLSDSSAQHPVPGQLPTSLEYSLFNILDVSTSFTQENRDLYRTFRGNWKSSLRSNMYNRESWWDVLPLSKMSYWEPSFLFSFPIILLFPWTPQLPLAFAQQPNTVSPPETGFSLCSGPWGFPDCRRRQEEWIKNLCFFKSSEGT